MKKVLVISFGLLIAQICEAQPHRLNKDSLLTDIDFLEQAVTEIHPGVYRYNNQQQIAEAFDLLRSQVTDDMSEADFIKRLAQTTAKFKCGHTYVNPWNMKKSIRERLFGGATYFPLGFEIIGWQFIVTHNASDESAIKQGAEIISINGISTQTIYDSLSSIAKYDGNNTNPIPYYLSLQDFRIRNWEPFDLYFPLFFPFKDSFTVTYRNFNSDSVQEVTLPALTKEERFTRLQAKYGDDIATIKGWSLDIESADLAIMRLGTFAIWRWKDFDYKKWFEESFRKLDSAGVENLVIDIRGNGGGLSEPRDELLSYLISQPISCDEQANVLIRTTKVDSALAPYCDTWEDQILLGLPKNAYQPYKNGFYELNEHVSCEDIKPKGSRYVGNVYLFGGPSNVSATFTLLERAKSTGFGRVIGQSSGGNQQGINGGSYIFFYLPYSEMEVDIPLKFFSRGEEKPDAGIAPDIYIEKNQKDIVQGNDPHMEKVLELISQQGQEPTEAELLDQIVSADWKGSLTYLDYSSGRLVSIPSELRVAITEEAGYEFQYRYPEEPQANQKVKIKIDLEKGFIEKRTISSKEIQAKTLIIKAEEKGKDNGAPVTFFYTYTISKEKFSIRKEFQKEGSNEKVVRNEYTWSK